MSGQTIPDAHGTPFGVGSKVIYNKSGRLRTGVVKEIIIGTTKKGFPASRPLEVKIQQYGADGNQTDHISTVRNLHGILFIGCFPCNCLRKKLEAVQDIPLF